MSAPGPRPTIRLLLGSLEPSEALSSTLTFLEWCAREPRPASVQVIALHPGAAAEQVRSLAPTVVVYDPLGWSPSRIAQRLRLQRAASVLRGLEVTWRLRGDDPVYVADPAGGRLLHRLSSGRANVVAHLHATSDGLAHLDDADGAILAERADHWIVGTDLQAEQLRAAGVDRPSTRLPDLLTLPGMDDLTEDIVATSRARLSTEHGIAAGARIVAGIGNVDWWSVPDAFVRVAWEVLRRPGTEDVHFLWDADGASDRMLWPLRHDIRHAGLEGRVHIDPGERRPWHHIAASDVLISTRLGDHQPTGHREAALMGRPVIWFADPDAADPLVAPSEGTSVPHLDVDAMADAVVASLAAKRGDGAALSPSAADAAWLPAVGGRAIVDLLARTEPGEAS